MEIRRLIAFVGEIMRLQFSLSSIYLCAASIGRHDVKGLAVLLNSKLQQHQQFRARKPCIRNLVSRMETSKETLQMA